MKYMRKLLAIALAIMLVMSLATTAFAAESTKITIDNTDEGYAYAAYRVFEGTLVDGELQNIKWSAGVDEDGLMEALADIAAFADCETAVDVATVLAGITAKDDATTQAFADAVADNLGEVDASVNTVTEGKGYVINVSGDGYYFVKTTAVPAATETTAAGVYTRYILKVVGDVTVSRKGSAPSVDKAIVENGTAIDNAIDAADASIGDDITFTLTATLPSDYDYYKAYTITFTDTLSSGLTYNGDAKVYVNGTEVELSSETGITISPAAASTTGGGTLTVTIDNLKKDENVAADSTIVVKYTAKLNANAVIGEDGNDNKVKLTYSNNPNDDGTGTPSTGDTPEDKVIIFTYELDVTKVDGVDNTIKLADAQFVLMDSTKTYVAKIENGKFAGWEEDATITKDQNGAYPEAYTLKSAADGTFKVEGLDQGTYYLKETVAPEGYNLPTEPFAVVISASVSEAEGITDLSATVGGAAATADDATGTVSGTIANNSGATLPETGGMGTTIFYIVGAVLVLGAAVLLVTKRRMNVAE